MPSCLQRWSGRSVGRCNLVRERADHLRRISRSVAGEEKEERAWFDFWGSPTSLDVPWDGQHMVSLRGLSDEREGVRGGRTKV